MRSDSSAFDDEPALPRPGVAAELRDLAADEPGRVEAELGEDEGDHPGRRRLPVRAGDDDRAPQRDELGEEVGARRPGDGRVRARDDRPPSPPARPARRRARPRRRRARAGTASRRGPSRRPRLPRRGRGTRTTRGRRRRCRRTRGAYPRADASAISSSAISSAACGRAIASIASRIEASRARIGQQLVDDAGHALELGLGDDDRAAAALEVPRVQRLVVARRMRIRDEHGRGPRGGELPDRAPRPRDGEIGRGERGAELVRRGDEHVVVPACTCAREALVVALAGHVQHRRPRVAVVSTAKSFRLRAPASAPKNASTGPRSGRPKRRRPSSCDTPRCSAGHRPAGDAILRSVAAGDLVREEDAPRERRREPVREPEVGVGLGQRSGHLPPPGRVDHRPGDVAAAAEDDVRPAALQDRRAGARRAPGPDQRAQERDGRAAREAGDLERVELVARLGDEPSLDAIRRPGERHRDAALAERCRDCERREHVTGCSAGRDQAP